MMIYEKDLRLTEISKRDPIYQELLHKCQTAEIDYLRIKAGLSAEDQDTLDRYIALCEELEYRRTYLAHHAN